MGSRNFAPCASPWPVSLSLLLPSLAPTPLLPPKSKTLVQSISPTPPTTRWPLLMLVSKMKTMTSLARGLALVVEASCRLRALSPFPVVARVRAKGRNGNTRHQLETGFVSLEAYKRGTQAKCTHMEDML